MTRTRYFYCLAPLLTLLSCLPNTLGLFPTVVGVVLACVLILLTWGLLWMRLFNTQCLRPELSILPILPYALYLYLTGFGSALLPSLQAPMWGNYYFVLWIVAAYVSAKSLKLSKSEEKASETKDTAGLMMRASCFLFAAFGWAACASKLFPPQ